MSAPNHRRPSSAVVALWIAFATVAAACSGDDGSERRSEVAVVWATTTIWADIVDAATCRGLVKVESLVPVGSVVHEYEPSLKDRGGLEDSDLVVANGLGLEGGFESTLDATENAGTPVFRIAEAADELLPIEGADGWDPHVWMDPIRVASTLDELETTLVSVGVSQDELAPCIEAFRTELFDLDALIDDLLAAVPLERRAVITNHDALVYFADRYRFDVIGSVLPANLPRAQADAAELAALIDLARSQEVRAVFTEPSIASDDARTVAASVGAEVVPLFVESVDPAADAASGGYVAMLLVNAGRIADALG